MEIEIYVVNQAQTAPGKRLFGWSLTWTDANGEHLHFFESEPRYSSAKEAYDQALQAQAADPELAKIPIAKDVVDRSF